MKQATLAQDAAAGQSAPAGTRVPHAPSKLAFLAPPAVLLLLFAFYLAMFPHYRPYDIDNPWFLSFSYDASVEHIASDQFMNTPFPRGMDGTQYFGKLAAFLQGVALSHFGWQQFPAVVLSSSFIVFGLGCWWLLLRRLGYTASTIASFLLVAGASEPLLSAANKARYEFLSFPMVSLALLLAAYDLPFLAALLAGLAVETQPVAIAGIVPVCLLAYARSRRRASLTLQLVAALGISLAVYLFLHSEIFNIGAALANPQDQTPSIPGGFFRAYFIDRPRHLPELLFLVLASAVYWVRRRSQPSHYLAVCAVFLTAFSLSMPHANVAYMIFLYPSLFAVAVLAFRPEHRPWVALGAVAFLLLPPELYLLSYTRGLGYRSGDIRAVSEHIAEVAREQQLDDRTLRVYGDYRLWFAHPHFYRASTFGTTGDAGQAEVFLCYDSPPEPASLEPAFQLYCPDFRRLFPLKLADSFLLRGRRVSIYRRR